MTAKEKAIELVKWYSCKFPYYSEKDNKEESKECALICVDEIIKSTFSKKTYEKWEIITCDSLTTEFWNEVKQELNNL